MRIYTDRGNTNALKLILAGVLSGKDLEIVEKKPDEKVASFLSRPKFPVLEDAEKQSYFSPNAAARLLLGNPDDPELSTVIDEWLEWEATQLQPVVQAVCIAYIQQGKAAEPLVTSLHERLAYLEQTTANNPQHLVGPNVSVVDVVVWCGIYSLFSEDSKVKDLTSAYPHVRDWFTNFHQLAAVSTAQKKLPGGSTWESLKGCLLSHPPTPLPSVSHSRAPQHQVSTDSAKSGSVASETDNTVTLPSVTPEEVKVATAAWNAGKAALSRPRGRKAPILPMDGERNILITSALPYVNNVPHLGNIIGCVLSADVFARFCRLRNLNTLYICGTDEYGTATETKAIEEGLTPQQICDKYNKLHSDIYKWFNIGFDYFGRTTTKQQTQIAQDIFWKLYNKNYILKDTIDQLQCLQCNRFLADRFVEGICPFCAYEDARGDQCDKCGKLINAVELIQPRCKQCQNTPVVKTSQHLFMDLPKLQPLLDQHLDENFEKGIFTSNTKVITKSWLRDGLKPRCISRDLKWGTPVPLDGYTDKVFYVWYDAPIGYISITANYTDQWEKWWKNPQQVELFNFMAKDNVPFHSVIFPSSLLGTGDTWTVVNNLSATEYLNYEDGKFSKSRGVGVFGNDAKDTGIPADVWRFYLLFLRPESQDSTFSWDDFVLKNNSELLNNLGNFINRALMFISNNFAGVIPQMTLLNEDLELIALINRELRVFLDNLKNIKLRDGLRNMLSISRYGNQYIQANKPWVKVKGTEEEKARAGTILGLAANVVCLLSVMMQPYMPAVSETVQSQTNAPASCNVLHDVFVAHLEPGHKIGKPEPLFKKIESSLIADLKARFAGKQSKESVTSPQAVTPKASPQDVLRLTDAVVTQGEVVRKLKTEKAEKSKIDEQVKVLLDLKKQLAAVQGPPTPSSGGASGKKNSKQKDKTKGVKAEVTVAQAVPKENSTPSTVSDPVQIETLTKKVATQGETVRQLKSQKGDKAAVDKAVATLLELKRQLAAAKGLDPEALVGGAANKKKGKKK